MVCFDAMVEMVNLLTTVCNDSTGGTMNGAKAEEVRIVTMTTTVCLALTRRKRWRIYFWKGIDVAKVWWWSIVVVVADILVMTTMVGLDVLGKEANLFWHCTP